MNFSADTNVPAGAQRIDDAMPGNPDLVDTIFAYLVKECPEIAAHAAVLKAATRKEFSGIETYIPRRSQTDRKNVTAEAQRLFNGRNAMEVARQLGVSRATVYRILKSEVRK